MGVQTRGIQNQQHATGAALLQSRHHFLERDHRARRGTRAVRRGINGKQFHVAGRLHQTVQRAEDHQMPTGQLRIIGFLLEDAQKLSAIE